MQAMQILHADCQPGDSHYGIPYTCVYVIDPDMQIAGTIFLEAYSVREDDAGALAYAREVLTSERPATAQ